MPTLNTLPVRVFKNLTRRCYSIQAKVGGRWLTVAHAGDVLLDNVTFKVSEAGRQRGLRTGRKQVHAWVHGDLVVWSGQRRPGSAVGAWEVIQHSLTRGTAVASLFGLAHPNLQDRRTVTYNPRRSGSFCVTYDYGTQQHGCIPVTEARAVLLRPEGMTAV